MTRKRTRKHGIELDLLLFLLGFLSAALLLNYDYQIPEVLEPLPVSEALYASSNIVAVSSYDNSGVLGLAEVEIYPGKGRILLNTNPFVEPDTQQSAETAAGVAAAFTEKNLSDRDIILSFNITGELVGGPSAGASITAAMIAAIENRQVNRNIVVTGTIEPDSSIGQIGGVLEKAQAAAENNMTMFLVPKGQGTVTYYEMQTEERRIGRFVYQQVYYVPRSVDVNNYTMQWGMATKEVSSIEDVVEYMIK
jgi:predicted S18 family serine protease